MSKWMKGIRGQLLVLVLVPVFLIAGGTFYSQMVMKDMEGGLEKLANVRLPLATKAGEMIEAQQGILRGLWAIHGNFEDAKFRELFQKKTRDFIAQYDESKKEYEALPRSEASRKVYEPLPAHWEAIKANAEKVLSLFAQHTKEADEKARQILVSDMRADITALESGFDELGKIRMESSTKEAKEFLSNAETAIWSTTIVGGFASLLLLAAGVWVASRLAGVLAGIAGHISGAATEVSMASNQLSDASQKLSSGASEAAASLEETVASLEELSSKVKLNADNSKEAGALSQSARTSAEEGEKEVQQLISAMGEITSSSKKIEEIINVIDDIAFQTNLLALNAAVEAARAGEQGRGFAVVAEAVRNLAQRSSSAAKDITSLIKESVDKVDRGSVIVDRSGATLKQIVVNSKKVADLTTEIALASEEQAVGLAQISKAMNQLDQATQGNAASAEETASSSEQLQAESETLKSQVSDLVRVIEGGNGTSVSVPVSHQKAPVKHHQTSNVVSMPRAQAHHHAPASAPASAPLKAEAAIPFDDEDAFKVSGF